MPFNSPFDAVNRRRSGDDDSSYPPAGYVPDTGSQMGARMAASPQSADMPQVDAEGQAKVRQDQMQQAANEAAQAKADSAQQKLDQQNAETQARADAETARQNGVITQPKVVPGPSGKAIITQAPQQNPDGTTAYQPKDLGVQQDAQGNPYQVQRNQWGAQDWRSPYAGPNAGGTAATKLNPQGQIMATPKGKGAESLPPKDVTDQGVTYDSKGNIQVAPGAPIRDPQVQPQIDAEEQKLVGAAAHQRIADTVKVAADQATEDFKDARQTHQNALADVRTAKQAAIPSVADGYDPTKAAADLQAAQAAELAARQDMIGKAQKNNDLQKQARDAAADPLGYLQRQQSGADQSPVPSTQPINNTGQTQPGAGSIAQPTGPGAASAGLNSPPGSSLGTAQQPDSGATPQPGQNQTTPPAAGAAPGVLSPAQTAQFDKAPGDPSDPATIEAKREMDAAAAQVNPAGAVATKSAGTWGGYFKNIGVQSLFGLDKGFGEGEQLLGEGLELPHGIGQYLGTKLLNGMKPMLSNEDYQAGQKRLNLPDPMASVGKLIKTAGDNVVNATSDFAKAHDTRPDDFVTHALSGTAEIVPSMVTGGGVGRALMAAQGFQQGVNGAKDSGRTPLQQVASGIVNGVVFAGAAHAVARIPFIRALDSDASGDMGSIYKTLQDGAGKATVAVLGTLAKAIPKVSLEGLGFNFGGSVASGTNPADLARKIVTGKADPNEVQQASSGVTGSLMQFLPFALFGAAGKGMNLAMAAKRIDSQLKTINDARSNLSPGNPPPPITRPQYISSLIQSNTSNVLAQHLSNVQAAHDAVDASSKLPPQAKAAAKQKVVASLPPEVRTVISSHLDASKDARDRVNGVINDGMSALHALPKPDQSLTHLDDTALASEIHDVGDRVQQGKIQQGNNPGAQMEDPTQRAGLPQATPEYLSKLQAESDLRAKAVGIQNDTNSKAQAIQDELKQSTAATNEIGAHPEGVKLLDRLNAYNTALPTGTPKADALTVQTANDIAPRVSEDDFQPAAAHYIPVSHEIEQLSDPNQKAFAKAAVKLVNGRELTGDEEQLMLGGAQDPVTGAKTGPAVDANSGRPMVTDGGAGPVLTDAGLDRLKTLVPSAEGILPKTEQEQRERQAASAEATKKPGKGGPPPLPKAEEQPNIIPSEPHPTLAGMPDEDLNNHIAGISASMEKSKAKGGTMPPHAHTELAKFQGELNRRSHAGAPVQPGGEVQYLHHHPDRGPEVRKGVVVETRQNDYRVATGDDADPDHTVPFSHAYPPEKTTNENAGNNEPKGEAKVSGDQGPDSQGTESATKGNAGRQKLVARTVAEHAAGKIDRIQVNDKLRNLGLTNEEVEAAVTGATPKPAVKPEPSKNVVPVPKLKPEPKPEVKDEVSTLPGLSAKDIAGHDDAVAVLSKATEPYLPLLKKLGMTFKAADHGGKASDFMGLGVRPDAPNVIEVDFHALKANLDRLPTPAARHARIEAVMDEETDHAIGEKTMGEIVDEKSPNASPEERAAAVEKEWGDLFNSLSPRQRIRVQKRYGPGMAALPDSYKGREYVRMISQLQRRGLVSEIADILTTKSKAYLARVGKVLLKYLGKSDNPVVNRLLENNRKLRAIEPTPDEDDLNYDHPDKPTLEKPLPDPMTTHNSVRTLLENRVKGWTPDPELATKTDKVVQAEADGLRARIKKAGENPKVEDQKRLGHLQDQLYYRDAQKRLDDFKAANETPLAKPEVQELSRDHASRDASSTSTDGTNQSGLSEEPGGGASPENPRPAEGVQQPAPGGTEGGGNAGQSVPAEPGGGTGDQLAGDRGTEGQAGGPDSAGHSSPEDVDERIRQEDIARREAMEPLHERDDLLAAVRKAGGLSTSDDALQGELNSLKEAKNKGVMLRLFRKAGLPLDRLRTSLGEQGFHFDTPGQMLEAIQETLHTGKPKYGGIASGAKPDVIGGAAVPPHVHSTYERDDITNQPTRIGRRAVQQAGDARPEARGNPEAGVAGAGQRPEASQLDPASAEAARRRDNGNSADAQGKRFAHASFEGLAQEQGVTYSSGSEGAVLASDERGSAYKLWHNDQYGKNGLGVRYIRDTGNGSRIGIGHNEYSEDLGRNLDALKQIPGMVPFEVHGTTERDNQVTKMPHLPEDGNAESVNSWVTDNPVAKISDKVEARGNVGSMWRFDNYAAIGKDGKPYLLTDVNAKNFRRDANGKSWLTDAIPHQLTPEDLADHPEIAKAVDAARAKQVIGGARVRDTATPDMFGEPAKPAETDPKLSKDLALRIYNKLSPDRAALKPGQAQLLERAERALGQKFLPGTTDDTKSPARDTTAAQPETKPASRATDQTLFDTGKDALSGDQKTMFGAGVAEPKENFTSAQRRAEAEAKANAESKEIAEKALGFGGHLKANKLPPEIGNHLPPTAHDAAKLMSDARDDLMKIVAPQFRSEEAGHTARILRSSLAEAAQSADHAEAALHGARALFDAKSPEFNRGVMAAIENNTPHPDPEINKIIGVMRSINNQRVAVTRSMPNSHFRAFIENYVPHMWAQADHEAAKRFYARKIQGSTAFLKHRSIPTIEEGIQAGLHLVSDNPVDLFLTRWKQMDKYVAGQRILDEMKQAGLAVQYDNDGAAPQGWRRIDDSIGLSTEDVPVDAKAGVDPKQGELLPGNGPKTVTKNVHYYAPESAAQILENHLSAGLRDKAAYKVINGAANVLNQAQLGFSAFHLGFTTLDAATSKLAIGLEHGMSGDVVGMAKRMAEVPSQILSPLQMLAGYAATKGGKPQFDTHIGSRMLKEWYSPGSQGEEIGQLVNHLKQAGGRVGMDKMYSNEMGKTFMKNLRGLYQQPSLSGKAKAAFEATWRAPLAAIEAASKPIMEYVVPRQKLAVFADMARFGMEKLGPDAKQDDIRRVMQSAWDSVDNRMGQLVYDNLHWDKTFKDMAMITTRSVGWNLGSYRELGGGTLDTAKALGKVATGNGRDAQFTHKMAYVAALHLMVGTLGTTLGYLYTGQWPKEIRDIFFPKTGQTGPDGHAVRLALPSYVKDEYAFGHQPGQTLLNKANPLLSLMSQVLNNKDFWGTEIRHPGDNAWRQAQELLGFGEKSALPFALTGAQRVKQQGGGTAAQVAPFFGLTPAAAWIDKSPAELKAEEIAAAQTPAAGRTQAAADKYQAKSQLMKALHDTDPLHGTTPEDKAARGRKFGALMNAAIKAKTITPGREATDTIEDMRLPPLERSFKYTSYDSAAAIWSVATPEEKTRLLPMMEKKADAALKDGKVTLEDAQTLLKQAPTPKKQPLPSKTP